IQFDPGNGFIHVMYSSTSPGGTLRYIRFDCNTNTWGTFVDSGIATTAGTLAGNCSVLRSDGSVLEFYSAGGTTVTYVPIAAQAFGAPVSVIAGSDCYGAAADGSDNIYLAYRENSGSSARLMLVSIDPT